MTELYRHIGQFTDVPAGGWYDRAVAWAAGSGIVQGMGQGRYMPDQSITREQMAVMLYRYGVQAGLSMTAQGSLSGFSDGGRCSDWSVEAMTWAVGAGILGGRTDGTLDPGGTATRAEVATMLQRFSTLFP
ncbi:Endo-1,4-beta-xylanase A [bioreactor metagenome]|uniref:Endo-1,4-beta-xylanase A n=1 Tax=bioreactor metagenome TaxID=1076179 RepID=A0A645F6W2_9ZZZZ